MTAAIFQCLFNCSPVRPSSPLAIVVSHLFGSKKECEAILASRLRQRWCAAENSSRRGRSAGLGRFSVSPNVS